MLGSGALDRLLAEALSLLLFGSVSSMFLIEFFCCGAIFVCKYNICTYLAQDFRVQAMFCSGFLVGGCFLHWQVLSILGRLLH